jgi:hypothetical protein
MGNEFPRTNFVDPMAIIPEVQERLLTAFPKSGNVALARSVQEGIFIADDLFEGESFLNGLVGKDLRGHIRRVGISHQLMRYHERGDLPFVVAEKQMPMGRWHWVEIKATGAIAHVCRTDDPSSFPDEAESRQDSRLRLQGDLLAWDPMNKKDLSKIIQSIPQLYAWLTFRVGPAQQLSHLCWVSPAADMDVYVGHLDILASLADFAPIHPTRVTPDPKDAVKLKDHIAASLSATDKRDKA